MKRFKDGLRNPGVHPKRSIRHVPKGKDHLVMLRLSQGQPGSCVMRPSQAGWPQRRRRPKVS
jgi:hypothetical protein